MRTKSWGKSPGQSISWPCKVIPLVSRGVIELDRGLWSSHPDDQITTTENKLSPMCQSHVQLGNYLITCKSDWIVISTASSSKLGVWVYDIRAFSEELDGWEFHRPCNQFGPRVLWFSVVYLPCGYTVARSVADYPKSILCHFFSMVAMH